MKKINKILVIILIETMMVTSTGCSFIKSGSLAHDVIDAAKEKAKNFAKEKWADIEEWATEDENMALKDVDSYGKMAYDQAKIILDSFDSKDVDRAKKVFCPYIQEEHGDELSDDIKECLDYVDGKIVSYDDPIIELSSEKTDENGKVTALIASKKMAGLIKGGRPSPAASGEGEAAIPCDVVIVAIGQGIETRHFEDAGIPIKRGVIEAENWAEVAHAPGVFAGGDCVTGPATVIRAIAAGKVAAANIDEYLGYSHVIRVDVDIPMPSLESMPPCGRVNLRERDAAKRCHDFDLMEIGMNEKEIQQESSRCLRCDYYGYGIFKGGREDEW